VKNSQRPVIFIPGFKGSTLVTENTLVWPNFLKAQFDNKTQLTVKHPTLLTPNYLELKAADVLQKVSVIPKILYRNIYGKFLQQFAKSVDAKLVLFPYDWRDDLVTTAKKLESYITEILTNTSESMDLICHSMGGLIASYLLQHLPIASRINRVFFIATPFQGAVGIVLEMIYGGSLGLNKTLLCQTAIASFRSSYYLLPRYANAIRDYDLFDIATWQKFNLGMLANQANGLTYLQQQFDKVNDFYKGMHSAKPASQHSKLIFINNTESKTPQSLILGAKTKILYNLGDMTVIKQSLQIPDFYARYNIEEHQIKRSHAESFAGSETYGIVSKYYK
jgi:pimeloyl-ACP methyl ester carboxylesterase